MWREAPGKDDVHRSATCVSSSDHEPFRDPTMVLRENRSGSTRECVFFPQSGSIRRPHRGLDGFVLVRPPFMAKDPVLPANRRRAEAALCRVAKAEAGILKTTWIPGQARNDKAIKEPGFPFNPRMTSWTTQWEWLPATTPIAMATWRFKSNNRIKTERPLWLEGLRGACVPDLEVVGYFGTDDHLTAFEDFIHCLLIQCSDLLEESVFIHCSDLSDNDNTGFRNISRTFR